MGRAQTLGWQTLDELSLLIVNEPHQAFRIKADGDVLPSVGQSHLIAMPIQTNATMATDLANQPCLRQKTVGPTGIKTITQIRSMDHKQGWKRRFAGLEGQPGDFVVLALQAGYLVKPSLQIGPTGAAVEIHPAFGGR